MQAGVDEVGRGCLAGPVVAAIGAVGLAITGIIGHYKKQAEEQRKLTKTLKEGSSEQVESLMEVIQKELEAAEARLENAKRGKSLIYQDIADLKLQIEQLDKTSGYYCSFCKKNQSAIRKNTITK